MAAKTDENVWDKRITMDEFNVTDTKLPPLDTDIDIPLDLGKIKLDLEKLGETVGSFGTFMGKLLAIGSTAAGAIGEASTVFKGIEPINIDYAKLAVDLFDIDKDILEKILAAEQEIAPAFAALRNQLLAGNYQSIVDTWEGIQPQIDGIVASSRTRDRISQLGDMYLAGGAFENAAMGTKAGQRYYGVGGTLDNIQIAQNQAMGEITGGAFGEPTPTQRSTPDGYMGVWGTPAEDYIDSPLESGRFQLGDIVGEGKGSTVVTGFSPNGSPIMSSSGALADFARGEGDVADFARGVGPIAELSRQMEAHPGGYGTGQFQLGDIVGNSVVTGFDENNKPIMGSARIFKDYLEGVGPIAEFERGEGALADFSREQEEAPYGRGIGDFPGKGIAGAATPFNTNRAQHPDMYAPRGGGGGGGGGARGGAQGFGYSPFGGLGGSILPGLERAAMTQPFRPLLASLNQQALYPGVSPITQSLFQDALQELPLGGALTQGQQRDIEQQSLQLAERQGNLRSRATDFAALFNTDQAKQVRQRERQSFAAGVNEMAQREQDRNRQFGINVEGATQRALGQDREFGLGVGSLLGKLNLQGQELAQRGGIASAELGQMAQRIEQDRINQGRHFLLNSMSPFYQAAQAVNPMQALNISGSAGIGFGGNYQQNMMNRPPATPVLFPSYAHDYLSPFAERNLMNQQQAGRTSHGTLTDYIGGTGSMAGNLYNYFLPQNSSWYGTSQGESRDWQGGSTDRGGQWTLPVETPAVNTGAAFGSIYYPLPRGF